MIDNPHIAVIGDTHLGRSLYGYDLTPHILDSMREFLRLCKRVRPYCAVHLGDVFDRPRPTLAQQKALVQWCNEFERAGIPIYLLVGNHDAIAQATVHSALECVKATAYQHVWVVERPMVTAHQAARRGHDCVRNLIFLPFPTPGIYRDAQQWSEDVARVAGDDRSGAQLVFSHLHVAGAKMGDQEYVYRGADYVLPDVPAELIVNGHIHTPQVLDGVVMPGSAQRLRFGESQIQTDLGPALIDPINCLYRLVASRRALRLLEFAPDASGWGSGGRSPTTSELLEDARRLDARQAIVKLQPIVDEVSRVDWGAVEAQLYQAGALHVAMASPVLVRSAKETLQSAAALQADPLRAARGFIKHVLKDKRERLQVYSKFKQLQEESDAKD